MMKKALLLATVLLGIIISDLKAQTPQSTYLYLEVNKELPVSIKLNNKNVKNNRKGYIIIPRLAEGENVLEFNFGNPNFKTHTFKFENTNKRSMGLNLMRVSGNQFVLQDVVNKKMINDESTLNSKPISVASTTTTTTTTTKIETPKRGIVKVYEAAKEDPVQPTKTVVPTIRKTVPSVTKPTNTVTPTTATPRPLAMYKNRKPLTEASRATRYKNYSKIKREKKRNARSNKKNQEPANEVQIEKPKSKNPKKVETPVVAQTKTADLRAQKEQVKAQEKEAKRLTKEKRKQVQLEQERLDYVRLEKERALRQENRLAKKKERTEQAADLAVTKEKEVISRKKKNYEKEFPNIEEKVINAEPTGNTSAKSKRKNYASENEASPIRCKNSVRTDKVTEWSLKLNKKFDDEARGNYIRKKLGTKCISTNNLGVVLDNLETQIGRYKLIRTLYPNIEDPTNMVSLNKYFQSKSFIAKLKELNLNNY